MTTACQPIAVSESGLVSSVCGLADLGGECQHVAAAERRPECAHLIEKTSQRPDVSFIAVRQTLNYLRTAHTHTHT